jgi:sugar O-acyltransferase (sialic acid O-acetyltransferase NeuD family)
LRLVYFLKDWTYVNLDFKGADPVTFELIENPKLLVVGSSGHASVLVDAIELTGGYRIGGYLDDTLPRGTVRRGHLILGGLNDAASICAEQSINDVVIAIGDNWWRRKFYSDLTCKCPNLKFPVVKHPSALIAASAEIGIGTAILAHSHVGPGSRVGPFCIINTGSSIDHDCTMQGFASIAPGVFTGGLVQIGECSAIGVGASVSDRISIGSHAVVGTGAVVVRDIPDLVVAYGNPARVQRPRREGEKYIEQVGASR